MNEDLLVVEMLGDVMLATLPDNTQRHATLAYDDPRMSTEVQLAAFVTEHLGDARRLVVVGPKVHTMNTARDVLIFTPSGQWSPAVRLVELAQQLSGTPVYFAEALTAAASWIQASNSVGMRLNHWRRPGLDTHGEFGLALVGHQRQQLSVQTGYVHTGGVVIPHEDAPYGMTWRDIPRPMAFIQERLTTLGGAGAALCFVDRTRGSREAEVFQARARETFRGWPMPIALFTQPLAIPFGARIICA